MEKRSIARLVLIGYSVLLIGVVVCKDAVGVAGWARADRDERVGEVRPGRGRGGRMGPGPANVRLPASRFAPLHANYVPFKTILPQLRGKPRWSSAIMNLVGNTLLFAPVGFLVGLLYPQRRWPAALVLAVGVGITMEVMEGLLRVGVVDIDDVLLNVLGVLSGYWIYRLRARRKEALEANAGERHSLER